MMAAIIFHEKDRPVKVYSEPAGRQAPLRAKQWRRALCRSPAVHPFDRLRTGLVSAPDDPSIGGGCLGHFSHERIAYKYLTWAWRMDEDARDGLTRQQFARYYMMKLGIGHDLTRIALNPKHPRKIASEAELLALRPELKQTE